MPEQIIQGQDVLLGLAAAGQEFDAAVACPDGIAVLGSHPDTVELAPFDKNWLIYACSPHNIEKRTLPRVSEWFEVHVPIQDQSRSYRYLRALEDMPVVHMRDKENMPCFPGAVAYPEREMKVEFGPFVFTSSIAFILAKAIMDCQQFGIKRIGIFGVMQASKTEFTYQKPGIQQLIWEAVKRDIDVVAPDVSRLFDPPPEMF